MITVKFRINNHNFVATVPASTNEEAKEMVFKKVEFLSLKKQKDNPLAKIFENFQHMFGGKK
jgi:hypothetical protein